MNDSMMIDTPSAKFFRTTLYVLVVITIVGITFSIALSSIAMGTAIAVWLVYLIRTGRSGFIRTPLDLFFVAYVIAEILATVFSVDPASSLVNMKRLFQISVLYLVIVSIDNESKFKYILGLLVAVTSILTLFELFSLSSIGGHLLRISFFQYYLTEAGIKMFVILLCLPVIIHPSTPLKWRLMTAAGAVVLFLGLVVTQTRSSWLGFIAGTITLAYLRNKKLLIALILLLLLFVAFAPQDYKSRALSIFDPTMTSNLTRIHMITTGWRMFLDYPVFGTGDIDLKQLYITYITPIDSGEGGHLHNNIMMLLVTLGIVGFAATMALFVRIFTAELALTRSVGKHWLYESAALGALAAYIGFHINGLFEWNFGDHEIAVFLWFTFGLAMVAGRLAGQPAESSA